MFYYFTRKYFEFLPRLVRNYLIDESWIQNYKMECTVINNLLASEDYTTETLMLTVIRNILNTNSRCVCDLSNLILGTTGNYEMNIGKEWSTLYYMNVLSK